MKEPNPAELERVLDDAAAHERAGRPAEALAVLDAAAERLSGFALYHYARGALLVRAGRVDDGVEALEEAARLEPELPEVQGNLGAALVERVQRRGPDALASDASQADLARGLDLLSKAARARRRLPEVHANHGRALTLAGRVPEALAAFDRALAIDPGHVAALYNKAAAHHRAGRDEDSLAVLEQLLLVAPGFEPALRSRQNALRRLGRL